MSNYNLDSKIQNLASEVILEEVNNQIVRSISIVKVEITNGGEVANIFYTHSSTKTDDEVAKEVNKTSSFISRLISKRLNIYKSPKMNFVLYKDLDKLNEFEAILKTINNDEEE